VNKNTIKKIQITLLLTGFVFMSAEQIEGHAISVLLIGIALIPEFIKSIEGLK